MNIKVVGAKIKLLREQRNMTQGQLAGDLCIGEEITDSV